MATDVQGAVQIGSAANQRLGKIVFLPDLPLHDPSRQDFGVIITGQLPTETALTEASWYSTAEDRRAARALQEHISMQERMSGHWIKIPAADHEHVQLLSEPDD